MHQPTAIARLKQGLLWLLIHGQARGAGIDARSLKRFDQYVRIILGLESPKDQAPGQQTQNYFPGLSAKPWHDPAAFSWIATLEESAQTIKDEFVRNVSPGELYSKTSGLNDTGQWSLFYLYLHGRRVEENCRRCPETVRAVESLPLAATGETVFSFLTASTHIQAHCGKTNARLRCQLPLLIPPGSEIRVGTETRSWEQGKCLLFDDSFEHEVWTPPDAARIVLIVDVWHPDLTDVEIWALRQLMNLSFSARRFRRRIRKNASKRPALAPAAR